VILITGHADVAEAVEAMHEGVYDFVAKPYAPERLVASVRRALEKRRLVLDNRRLRAMAADNAQSDWPLIGQTPVMERLRATCASWPTPTSTCCWRARPGSARSWPPAPCTPGAAARDREFVAVDCAALPSA
jgi:two-component system C4-dicarboxylate transport response regulator DctD